MYFDQINADEHKRLLSQTSKNRTQTPKYMKGHVYYSCVVCIHWFMWHLFQIKSFNKTSFSSQRRISLYETARHCLVIGPEFGYICLFGLKPCGCNKLGRVPDLFISKQEKKENVSVHAIFNKSEMISNRGTFVESC